LNHRRTATTSATTPRATAHPYFTVPRLVAMRIRVGSGRMPPSSSNMRVNWGMTKSIMNTMAHTPMSATIIG